MHCQSRVKLVIVTDRSSLTKLFDLDRVHYRKPWLRMAIGQQPQIRGVLSEVFTSTKALSFQHSVQGQGARHSLWPRPMIHPKYPVGPGAGMRISFTFSETWKGRSCSGSTWSGTSWGTITNFTTSATISRKESRNRLPQLRCGR